MATAGDRVHKFLEDTYPALAGLLWGGVVFFFSNSIVDLIKDHNLKMDQAYSGIFGIATVLTGFLFTFYSFVITTDHGFIGKARSSIYLKKTVNFTIDALRVGSLAALCSLPMMVWQPTLSSVNQKLAFAFWVALSVWSLLSFERAARLFILFTRRHSP